MSKRDRLLHIIEQFTSAVNEIPSELNEDLMKAKQTLQKMTDEEFNQVSDHVFSSPATEHRHDAYNPDTVLQSLYAEMERLARHSGGENANKAIKEMQYYYGIEEKDGYFP